MRRRKAPKKKLSRAARKKYNEKRRTARLIKKLKAEPKVGSPEYVALQKEWYSKLASQGFVDLEGLDSVDGLDGYLKNRGSQAPARIKSAYNTELETYYRRLTNFIAHNPEWSNKWDCRIAQMYVNGVSYRKIVAALRKQRHVTNIWRVHKVVKALEVASGPWNRQHPEGLDFQADIGISL